MHSNVSFITTNTVFKPILILPILIMYSPRKNSLQQVKN